MKITCKRRKFIEQIKNGVLKEKIETLEQLLYLEEKRHQLFPQKELVFMVEVAIKEFATEKGWEMEYLLAHSQVNYIMKGTK